LLDGTKAATAEFLGDFVGDLWIRVNYSDQAHRLAFVGKLLVDARMVAPEGARADYGDIDQILFVQCSLPGAGCRESRNELNLT
jgi:hypothetical protein